METLEWSQEEFGHAAMENVAQRKRLVQMGARCAEKPNGTVTEVFTVSAEREGAYRFLENDGADVAALLAASAEAGLRRASGAEFVFVPVDGSSLSLPDPDGARGLGSVGARSKKGTGIEVMNALIVLPDGMPVGLGAQTWWVRGDRPKIRKEKRLLEEKETRHWLTAMQHVIDAAKQVVEPPPLWFQLDRGGDFREMLQWIAELQHWVTVRAAHDRRIESADEAYLWDTVAEKRPLGTFTLDVPEGRKRKARQAQIVVRACPTTIILKHRWTNERWPVQLYAVLAREEGTTPPGEEPIEWMLHTNRKVTTFRHARLVVRGYAMRWRIEEFHKTWKSVCHIEKSRLRTPEAIQKMASLMAAVAVRIERLKYLARSKPEAKASTEFSQVELEAIALMHERSRRELPIATIAVAVALIAKAGGYTGERSSGGPPGSIVLGRGLLELNSTVRKLLAFRRIHGLS